MSCSVILVSKARAVALRAGVGPSSAPIRRSSGGLLISSSAILGSIADAMRRLFRKNCFFFDNDCNLIQGGVTEGWKPLQACLLPVYSSAEYLLRRHDLSAQDCRLRSTKCLREIARSRLLLGCSRAHLACSDQTPRETFLLYVSCK